MAKTTLKSPAVKKKSMTATQVVKSAPKAASVTKTAQAKAAAAKKAPTAKPSQAKVNHPAPEQLSPEERQRMIELAAYHIAERDGFQPGQEHDYWLQGEEQINLTIGRIPGSNSELH